MIRIFATGGTIASQVGPDGGARPVLGAAELLAAVPDLATAGQIEVEEFSRIPGDYMGPELWQKLSQRVDSVLAEPGVRGVVITHGTDTLEETAYFLHLTVKSPKPVILTGAQRSASESGADGPRNLLDAVHVAADPRSAGRGTMVVFGGKIHGAREVVKVHTYLLDAFDSGDRGLLGRVTGVPAGRGYPPAAGDTPTFGYGEGGVTFFRDPPPDPGEKGTAASYGTGRGLFDAGRLNPGVEIVAMYGGADARLLEAAVAGGAAGVIIQALGPGNMNRSFYRAACRALAQGVVVVVATRVHRGPVLPRYSFEGGGKSLADAGAILAGDLSPQKARIALMLALGVTADHARLAEIIRAL